MYNCESMRYPNSFKYQQPEIMARLKHSYDCYIKEKREEQEAQDKAKAFKERFPEIKTVHLNKKKGKYYTTIVLTDGRKATVTKHSTDEHSWDTAMYEAFIKVLRDREKVDGAFTSGDRVKHENEGSFSRIYVVDKVYEDYITCIGYGGKHLKKYFYHA